MTVSSTASESELQKMVAGQVRLAEAAAAAAAAAEPAPAGDGRPARLVPGALYRPPRASLEVVEAEQEEVLARLAGLAGLSGEAARKRQTAFFF